MSDTTLFDGTTKLEPPMKFPDQLFAVIGDDPDGPASVLAYPSMGDCGCPGERLTIATYKLVETGEYDLAMQVSKVEKGKS